ncbi:MAG: HAD-IIA family hydrolase [Anaerolineales bacterium]|nr:HAD-IIA family hydrolase [Anaerolineales bacterium]
MPKLSQIVALVIDMDGVLMRGDSALPGVMSFFKLLRERSLKFVIATNNATTSAEMLCERLAPVGVRIEPEQVITSGIASASYLKDLLPPGSQIYVIGESPLRKVLKAAGFHLTESANDIKAVVVGLDRQLNWEKLTEAALAIQAGATFIATNPDLSLPVERGQAIGTGAILAAIEATTGVAPIVIGKPEPHLFQYALQHLKTKAENTLVVGDRFETDVLGGKKAGMPTALILTGITQRQDLSSVHVKPDWIFENLDELTTALDTSV